MRVQGIGAGGAGAAGFANPLIDRIMEVERVPLAQARGRRDHVAAEKNEYSSLAGMLGDLGSALNELATPSRFTTLKLDSSHPDIVGGQVEGPAVPGAYDLEVKGLAAADKHLAFAFPDKDKTPVGFGFLQIEMGGGKLADVVVDPGSTLRDVAAKINDAGAGVQAQIIHTGMSGEPFRLLVTSVATGAEAAVHLDPDTTYLEFQDLKQARSLDARFEGVPITRRGNQIDDLIGGVKLDAKRAAPGTRVHVEVRPDLEKTLGNIKLFTDKYNQVARYMNQQFAVAPGGTHAEGKLAGDGDVRSMLRQMQSQLAGGAATQGRYGSLAEVGITTDAHTGELKVDNRKLKAALTTDYDGVAKLFVASESGLGVAARLAETIRHLKDPVSGALASRVRGLNELILQQNQSIENQTRRLNERQEQLKRQFGAMQSRLAGLHAQGNVLAARFGSGETAYEPYDRPREFGVSEENSVVSAPKDGSAGDVNNLTGVR